MQPTEQSWLASGQQSRLLELREAQYQVDVPLASPSELSKNKVHYPSVGEIARHNSIFIARDKATYKAEKLTTSINVARESCPEQVLSAKKIYEIIERKNQ